MAANTQPLRSASNRFKLKLDGIWSDINLCNSSILEISFPLTHVNVQQEVEDGTRQHLAQIEPNMPIIAKLLALTVDHIDLLLEDWYPSLGTRFVHTSEGRFLITRLVMCPRCLKKLAMNNKKSESSDNNGAGGGGGGGNGSADVSDGAVGLGAAIGYTNRVRAKRPIYFQSDNGDDAQLNVFSAYLNATARRERRSEVNIMFSINSKCIFKLANTFVCLIY